jgi:cell division protein FtsW
MVMVYSASVTIAEAGTAYQHQTTYFLRRHAMFLVVGLLVGLAVFQISSRNWQEAAPWLFMLGLVLLAVVLIPGIGRNVKGASRWIPLGPLSFQPSELMKLLVAIYVADYASRKMDVLYSVRRGILPIVGLMVLVGALLLQEPDFGAFMVIAAIALAILFIGGINLGWFSVATVLLIVGGALLVFTSPYRRDRVFGFMDPWADAQGKGYQLSHSLIAFGRGEWWGVGLGGSLEKLFYLPEAHTDFLLAVIAEELGLIGVLVVLLLFAFVVTRIFVIARRAAGLDRPFSALTAFGIGTWIAVQGFVNMGVNMGLLPTKGLTLPFMSYGGSGIVVNCMAIALVLRIDWESRQLQRGLPA